MVSGFSGGVAAGSSRGNNGGGVDGFIDGDGGGRIHTVVSTLAFTAVSLLCHYTCGKVSLANPGI